MSHLRNDSQLSQLRAAGTTTTEGIKVAGVHYHKESGKPVKLEHGAIVEGSIDHGGIQPHYVVDLDHPSLRHLLTQARSLGSGAGTPEQKIGAVAELVRDTLKHKAYDSAPYLDLLRQSRVQRRNVNLGDYIDTQSGVCREHAMMTHLALSAAGFDTEYVYANARQRNKIEDHAVATVILAGTRWVVDAYNVNFDGFRLDALARPTGSASTDVVAPWARGKRLLGCRLELTKHPNYWLPVVALPG